MIPLYLNHDSRVWENSEVVFFLIQMNDFQPSHLVATNQHSFQLKTFLLLVESPLFTGWWYTYPFEKI